MAHPGFPKKQGLYDPRFEHDACGVGFVARLGGEKSYDIISMALQVLENMTHRGAAGADPLTGDGAGILIQTPDAFLREECAKIDIQLPAEGDYAVGMVFLPTDEAVRISCEKLINKTIAEEGQGLLGWRDVPVATRSPIGYQARAGEPIIKQVIIGANGRPADADDNWFERKLFIIRKRIENASLGYNEDDLKSFHICSMSSRTLLYKGMFLADQVPAYYNDLRDKRMVSAFAMVHQRYSTNTFPTWDLAQPFRMICHNGEINTLRGNLNWMRAREAIMSSELFGDDIKKVFPLIPDGLSDSASFDRALEFLVMSGRSLPHAMMMLIPEAWENHKQMDDVRKGFYEYSASMMEPWDGPAGVCFTDGRVIGGALDRNGLRPARYQVTHDGLCVMASEAGTFMLPPEEVKINGRLQPGRMFVIDMNQGRIIDDEELKQEMMTQKPYKQWVDDNLVALDDLPDGAAEREEPSTLLKRQQMFGVTEEDLTAILAPMALGGQEPTGSMGNDAPLAVLSDKPILLFNYFKQLFAQVTNPAIDPIREELVMTLYNQLGPTGNLMVETEENAKRIKIKTPILTNAQLEKLRATDVHGIKAQTFPMLFPRADGAEGMETALRKLLEDVSSAVANDGVSLVILSDRGADADHAPMPSLLVTSGVHHTLIRAATRNRVSIIVETGEPKETAHFNLLVGYGAGAVNPYLVFDSLKELVNNGTLPEETSFEQAQEKYIKAVGKGMLKIFSKMGISTLQSYCGAQIFEAVGLSEKLVEKYFTGSVSRLSGVGLKELAQEALDRHQRAFGENIVYLDSLDVGGDHRFRHGGERHMWSPQTISLLQQACRENRFDLFQKFSKITDDQAKNHFTLRGLFKLKSAEKPIPLEEVEPASEIVKRFVTGAMSYGSISKEAHETLAIAMNRLGGMSNTGEGGEDPERYKPRPNGDSANSAIKQVASGRFGVTSHYLANSREMQIKIAQGAKPGEGGQLPGHKVNEVIGRTRNTMPGVTLISPPPHHDIYSIEDLAQLIYDLKNVNPEARVSVKLVAEVGVGTIAAGVSKGHADMILIAGHDGGTGASPVSSIKHAGAPWELGLAETQQTLVLNDLRGRVRLQTDGQLRTGRDVVVAALLGAEEYGFATSALIVEGCVMMRKCHLGTCPVGVATQDLELRKKFTGKPQHVVNFFFFIANEARQIMAEMGFRTIDEMIGRVDRIEQMEAIDHWKAKGLDLTPVLTRPDVPSRVAVRCVQEQDHNIKDILDLKLLELASLSFKTREPIEITLPIHNTDRTVGAMMGGRISKLFGADGLPEDTIKCNFKGSAGQSFGAFNVNGVSFTLEGTGNDYVGKGMSGGRIVIYPPKNSTFVPEEHIIVGNTLLYGATGGEAYFRGLAGERFAVRNSGAKAVVEGLGDHGCEYMTGGTVVVLGETGRNFGAGMSGGVAFVWDPKDRFRELCNPSMVGLEAVAQEEDKALLKKLLNNHLLYTGSTVAEGILKDFEGALAQFHKVMPFEYKRVLEEAKREGRVVNG